ncbi:peptidase S9 [Oleiagrimonas sp. MCCC 1A03011]|nr:peptidase S9 [Oleiagrimonas sp. MCCC 1A03011]
MIKQAFLALSLCAVCFQASAADSKSDKHPFNVRDLVMLKRVSDPHLSPDGNTVAFSIRRTDYDANKGRHAIDVLDLRSRNAKPHRLVDNASSPRWSRDGSRIFFLSSRSGSSQLWWVSARGGAPVQATHYPLDVTTFKLSPDGVHVALTMDAFTDCATLACTRQRLDARAADKASGTLYKKLFVRHWDTWSDGRRSQLYVAELGAGGKVAGEPVHVSRGIDGDIPSKPFGDDGEYSFSPQGDWVYFDVRIAGRTEPWSTNFDIYRVPTSGSAAPKNLTASNKAWDAWPVPSPDGRSLFYLAQKTPGFESDRFAIMKMDLATGKTRELDEGWDRSPGSLSISHDGKTLYATADDEGQHPLFAIDAEDGGVDKVVGDGHVAGYDVALAVDRIVLVRDSLTAPGDLYTAHTDGGDLEQVTHVNAAALAKVSMGQPRWFTFKGWNDERVQGYVVTPADFDSDKTYPVAFIIHGGPQGAMTNSWSYRWNPQTYAGQGFAVVTVNFHGSTGYGQDFTDSISGDWGGKPLDDLKAGWKYALDKYDFLDGDRACALGASYGGYMVYWMAGVWNKPWKCFVDHDGVFDARMMYYATDELWFEERENGGMQFRVPQNYEKFNPIDHVKDWRVPMLVVHSAHDYRIPLTQGLGAFTALQRQGIPSEFLTFPDENHWVLKPHNSVQWHDTVNAWLKRWTPATDKPKKKSFLRSLM